MPPEPGYRAIEADKDFGSVRIARSLPNLTTCAPVRNDDGGKVVNPALKGPSPGRTGMGEMRRYHTHTKRRSRKEGMHWPGAAP